MENSARPRKRTDRKRCDIDLIDAEKSDNTDFESPTENPNDVEYMAFVISSLHEEIEEKNQRISLLKATIKKKDESLEEQTSQKYYYKKKTEDFSSALSFAIFPALTIAPLPLALVHMIISLVIDWLGADAIRPKLLDIYSGIGLIAVCYLLSLAVLLILIKKGKHM